MKITALIRPRKIQLISLGCSKNRVDSEHLLKQIEAQGGEIVPEEADLSHAGADAVIINTCGFIQDAKEESINAVLTAVDAKNKGYIKYIFVFGCLSQRYREELEKEIPEVDGFFGASDTRPLLEAIGMLHIKKWELKRHLTTPKHYAYLKISEGCDRTCSYCAIPMIRGKHVSVPMEDLVREAENLAAKGVRELIVVAQDTTYYGLDLYGKRSLSELLRKLCGVKGIEWIRVHYSYPAQFPEDVLETMATESKICKYLDIPLQHCDSRVLEMMRRGIDGYGTQAIIDSIRKKVPGVVLRTTLIVGHPGEDSRAFEALLKFVEKNRFERLGAFTYSEEEGTYGAKNFRDSVRPGTKQRRYERLMELQAGISLAYNESRIGTVEEVIVDSVSDGVITARSRMESPEVDGEILIGVETLPEKTDPQTLIGNFMKVKITGANEYDLLAEPV